jgi:hypothetical protein
VNGRRSSHNRLGGSESDWITENVAAGRFCLIR